MSRTFRQSLLVLLVSANCIAAIMLFRSSATTAVEAQGLKTLMTTRTVDQRKITRHMSPLLVEIIDSEGAQAAEHVTVVANALPQKTFTWMIVTDNAHDLSAKTKVHLNDTYWIEMNISAAKKLLAHETIGDEWLLFDENLTLRKFGNFVHGGLPGELAALVDNAPAFSPQVVQLRFKESGEAVRRDIQWQNKNEQRWYGLLVHVVSSGCNIQDRIEEFDRAAAADPKGAYVILVPATWTPMEVLTLQTNLDVHHAQIRRASRPVTAVWLQLAAEFGNLRMNGVLLILDANGLETVYTEPSNISVVLQGRSNAK